MTTPNNLIERAREIAVDVAREAPNTDRNGFIADSLITSFCDAGFMETLVPKRYGGHELDYRTMAGIVSAIAPSCTSTAWVLAFYIGHNFIHALFPQESQDEVFGDRPFALTPGTLAPNYSLKKVAGGYVANGRSSWNSGSSRADWILCNGLIREEGQPPVPRCFLVPVSDVAIIPNWDVAGMRGTSSHDVELNEVFVPEYRTTDTVALLEGKAPGAAIHPNPLYSKPLLPFTMGEVMPVVVGAYRGAADEFRRLVEQRTTTFTSTKVAGMQTAQIRVGKAQAGAAMAELMLKGFTDMLSDTPLDELRSINVRAAIKAQCALITDYCCEGISEMMLGAGAAAYRNDSPMQRYFRDINMLHVHGFLDLDTAAQTYGRVLMGLPTESPL